MTHYMNLRPHPFSMIADGSKTIELRLLDEKRRSISVGDTLIFKNTENTSDTLSCVVTALHVFDSFESLYRSLPLERCGYLESELANADPKDMEEYYPVEKQKKYGVLGIEIELI